MSGLTQRLRAPDEACDERVGAHAGHEGGCGAALLKAGALPQTLIAARLPQFCPGLTERACDAANALQPPRHGTPRSCAPSDRQRMTLRVFGLGSSDGEVTVCVVALLLVRGTSSDAGGDQEVPVWGKTYDLRLW